MAHPWASAFGIVGNIISFLVFLAPTKVPYSLHVPGVHYTATTNRRSEAVASMDFVCFLTRMHVCRPTFLRVYRKKSTEGFSSVPYVVALFSCMLWILYALVKTNSSPLLTINAFGCVVEAAYILLYLIYAPRTARLRTLASFFVLNVAAFSLVVVVSVMLVAEPHRIKVLGSICLAFSMAVFVAPMSVIFVVIKTKSAEFMPFSLSFFLTLSAVAWFFYGLFTKDLYVTLPNVGGFFFGCVQMALNFCYRKPKSAVVLPTTTDTVVVAPVTQAEDAHAVAVLPVLAELHKMEQEIGTPRKRDIKTV